jgi:hypothetical protein
MKRCPSGKVVYNSISQAEDALVESWIRNHYRKGQGPVNVYPCDDCGNFHLTSKGLMNARLQMAIETGEIQRLRRAWDLGNKWRGK